MEYLVTKLIYAREVDFVRKYIYPCVILPLYNTLIVDSLIVDSFSVAVSFHPYIPWLLLSGMPALISTLSEI